MYWLIWGGSQFPSEPFKPQILDLKRCPIHPRMRSPPHRTDGGRGPPPRAFPLNTILAEHLQHTPAHARAPGTPSLSSVPMPHASTGGGGVWCHVLPIFLSFFLGYSSTEGDQGMYLHAHLTSISFFLTANVPLPWPGGGGFCSHWVGQGRPAPSPNPPRSSYPEGVKWSGGSSDGGVDPHGTCRGSHGPMDTLPSRPPCPLVGPFTPGGGAAGSPCHILCRSGGPPPRRWRSGW